MAPVGGQTDYGLAWAAASLTGIASSAILIGGSFANWHPIGTLFFALWVVIVGGVIWLIGVLLVGIPLWIVLQRLGAGGPIAAALLGAIVVGVVWAAVTAKMVQPSGTIEEITELAAIPAALGALSGALAGYAGWRAGRPKSAVSS